MLKIIAIASEDGWAFVDRDGDVLLIKPAYSQSNLLATSRVSAGKAIYKYRFEAMDESFPDWAALLEFLRRRLSERHSKEDVAPPGEFAPEILEDAPKELKAKLLAWIGKELIPNREWKAAIVLLKALQKSTGTPELWTSPNYGSPSCVCSTIAPKGCWDVISIAGSCLRKWMWPNNSQS